MKKSLLGVLVVLAVLVLGLVIGLALEAIAGPLLAVVLLVAVFFLALSNLRK